MNFGGRIVVQSEFCEFLDEGAGGAREKEMMRPLREQTLFAGITVGLIRVMKLNLNALILSLSRLGPCKKTHTRVFTQGTVNSSALYYYMLCPRQANALRVQNALKYLEVGTTYSRTRVHPDIMKPKRVK